MTYTAHTLASLGLAGGLFLASPIQAQGELQRMPVIIAVQATGELPGFRIEDASPYLASQMVAAGVAAWRFVPRDMGTGAPNRIEWNFEVLPYAGGQVRQFFPMTGAKRMLGAHRLIAAQAKLYLGGQYQTMTIGQEAVQGGANDPELAAFLARLTHTLESGYQATDLTPALHKSASP